MNRILILDNQIYRREKLAKYLSHAGFTVSGSDGSECPDKAALSGMDLVVLNFHPDVDRTWEMYFWFRQQHPYFPVIVYAEESFQAFRSLKQVITTVLNADMGSVCKDECPCMIPSRNK